MSAPFRLKILNELQKPRSDKLDYIKRFFDNGKIRIERKDWEEQYGFALSRVEGIDYEKEITRTGGISPMLEEEWKEMADYARAKFKSDSVMKVSPAFKYNSSVLELSYRRNVNAKKIKGQGIQDLEKHAKNMLIKIMQEFFVVGKFAGLEKHIAKKSTDSEYGHGKKDASEFSDDPNFPTPRGAGAEKKIRDHLQTNTASGAQGIIMNNVMKAALREALKSQFAKEGWFTSFTEVLNLKLTDIFGYDTEVMNFDRKDSKKSEAFYYGKVMPKGFSDKMKLNPHVFDTAIKKELVAFLGGVEGKDPSYFIKEAKRLDPTLTSDKALSMFIDSPSPKDKIEKAAIALIAAGVMDDISEKYVKKDISSKLSKENKTGSKKSKTKAKGRSAKRRQTSTKAKALGLAQASRRRNNASGLAGQMAARNPIALKELIQAALPDEILERMTLPALVNRTGRFRQSATITNVLIGARGGTEVEYTYMKDPYQTFEPGGKRGGTYRDPRRIIGGAIKDIAMDLTGNKFIRTRRV